MKRKPTETIFMLLGIVVALFFAVGISTKIHGAFKTDYRTGVVVLLLVLAMAFFYIRKNR